MRSLFVFFVLVFVLFCACSVVLTGNPLSWIGRIDCILGTGAFGSCLSFVVWPLYRSDDEQFYGVDCHTGECIRPNDTRLQSMSPILFDTWEDWRNTKGEYEQEPISQEPDDYNECFVCGVSIDKANLNYVSLPTGDMVSVCQDHICEHGNLDIWSTSHDRKQIENVMEQLHSLSSCNPYMKAFAYAFLGDMDQWIHPCHTCRTMM